MFVIVIRYFSQFENFSDGFYESLFTKEPALQI